MNTFGLFMKRTGLDMSVNDKQDTETDQKRKTVAS